MTRFVLYSHDTYGLGHLRRCTLLATALVGADPDSEVLILTGSPQAQAFRLPERVDTVKLPCATKDDRGNYRPRKLSGGIGRLLRLRSDIITSTVLAFEPDVLLVDHAPIGMGGELGPLLDRLSLLAGRPRLVLGLRDIIDDAGRVDATWHRDGVWDRLAAYDEILVYGDESVVTTAQELHLARRLPTRVSHTGYLAPTMPETRTDEPFVLVTPGGGGDGQRLLRRYLDAVSAGALGGLRSVVVTGPLLSAGRRAEMLTRAAELPSVEMIEFSGQLRSLISSAVGVISMAGYNTVVEELAAGSPALLVPRCAPRLEQYIRAARLAPRTSLDVALVESLDQTRIRGFVDGCRNGSHGDLDDGAARPGVAIDGVARAAAALLERPTATTPTPTTSTPSTSMSPNERLLHAR